MGDGKLGQNMAAEQGIQRSKCKPVVCELRSLRIGV